MYAQPANIPYSCKDENNASKEWKTPLGGKERGLILAAIRSDSEVQIIGRRHVSYKITRTRWYGSPPSIICMGVFAYHHPSEPSSEPSLLVFSTAQPWLLILA
jgi:hypothetical protein